MPAKRPCAILRSESHLDFAKSAPYTGGPAYYTNLLSELKAVLEERGLAVDFVSEADLAGNRLCDYRVLYIADTFSIRAETEEAIRYFVSSGGVLVGINEVGRIQGEWTWPWHYEDLFGVEALRIDQFRTALAFDSNLFHTADITAAGEANPLTRGWGRKLDFGTHTVGIWVTKPVAATPLATFPTYVRQEPQPPHAASLVNDPVVAVSVNDFGKGRAVWISVNMHARNPSNLREAGATADLLARAVELVPANLFVIPPMPPKVFLGLSQIGYAPGERKRAIIRVPDEERAPFDGGSYRVMDAASGREVAVGVLTASGPDNPWRDFYYIADFSSLRTEGDYRFEAELSGPRGNATVAGGPFHIASNLWTSVVTPVQFGFLHDYRCGEQCHLGDPVRGGFHDATGDYCIRMWSMPHIAYGLAECLLSSAALPDEERTKGLAELRVAVDWMLAMQDARGQVWRGVATTNQASPVDLRPAQDPSPRVIEKEESMNYQTTFIPGMAHAARALKVSDADRSAKALAAARKAHDFISRRNWRTESSGELGNYLWGCVALFQATGETQYLREAASLAPVLLGRQCANASRIEAGLRGDFFEGPGKTTFGDRQYKKYHTIGLYLGLVELAAALPPGDPLRAGIVKAMDLFFDDRMLKGAALTPYGQMVIALERDHRGGFKVQFFSHKGAWVRLHGLNCDHLALGYTALKFADLTGRSDLRDFARAQAQWVVGQNPLGYCMIDYVGWNVAPMIDERLGTGRFKGGMPNGIVGDVRDRPMWGASWDSREYWLPHNAYLLAIAPRLDAAGRDEGGAP